MTQKFRVLLNCILSHKLVDATVHTRYESLRSCVIMFCVRSQGNKICQRCLCPQVYCSLISNNGKGEGKKETLDLLREALILGHFSFFNFDFGFICCLCTPPLFLYTWLYFSLCLNSIIFPSASVIALLLSLLHLAFW